MASTKETPAFKVQAVIYTKVRFQMENDTWHEEWEYAASWARNALILLTFYSSSIQYHWQS